MLAFVSLRDGVSTEKAPHGTHFKNRPLHVMWFVLCVGLSYAEAWTESVCGRGSSILTVGSPSSLPLIKNWQ